MTVMPTAAGAGAPSEKAAEIAEPPVVPPSSGLWRAAADLGVPTTEPTTLTDRWRSGLYIVASLLLLALVWQALSYLVGADVPPGPVAAILAIEQSSREGYLWSDIGITAFRIVGAFLIALAAALAIGTLLGRSRLAERLFGPWVTIGASIPSLVIIVIVYLSVGVNDHAAMVGTALIVAPPMIFAVWDGIRAINPELQEMARAFAVPKFTILWRVILPPPTPLIFTPARTGVCLALRRRDSC